VTEALEFAEILDDFDTQVWALTTLSALNGAERNYGVARREVERLRQIADRITDPAIVATSDRRMGYMQYVRGRFREAQQNFERALQFRYEMDDRQPAFWSFPVHQPSISRAMLAQMLWLRGFTEQALNESTVSLDDASATDQLSICRVLTFGICRIATMTRELVTADREIARLIELSTRLNAPFWQATERFLEGKLMVERHSYTEALSTLLGAFDMCRHIGHFASHEFKEALAEAFAGLGRFSEALDAVDDAITSVSGPDAERSYLPELLPIKGEVLLQQDGSGPAEDCFNQARDKGALFWELRLALSLARLRMTQRRDDEARKILVPVYERLTYGYETTDLRAARIMLSTLQTRNRPRTDCHPAMQVEFWQNPPYAPKGMFN
jgi:tetratricopeptide (TPR) repeat protein